MKNKLILCIVFVFAAQLPFQAKAEKEFGMGLMVGSLVSITGKYWLSTRGALDFGLGFSGYPGTAIYVDYLWHVPAIFGTGTQFGRETKGYVGGGGGVGFWGPTYSCGRWNCDRTSSSGTGVFVRGLFGFEWSPAATRFGVFAELGPTFLVSPGVIGSLDIGLGGRYYF